MRTPEFQHAVKRLNRNFDLTRDVRPERKASPITRLERPIAASIFERRLEPDVFRQFMRMFVDRTNGQIPPGRSGRRG